MSARIQRLSQPKVNKSFSKAVDKSTAEFWGPPLVVMIIFAWIAGLIVGFELALTVLVIGGFVAAGFGLRLPGLGLLAIGILATLDTVTRNYLMEGGLLRWNTLNYWLILVILVYWPLILRLKDPNTRLLQVFTLLFALQILVSMRIFDGLADLLNIIAMFGIVIYFARSFREEGALIWLGITSGVLGATGMLVYYLQMDSLPYINPNSLAEFPLMALFAICFGFTPAVKLGRSRFLLILLAVLNFVMIYLSGSRGNLLTAVCCLVFLFLSTRDLSWKTFILVMTPVIGFWLTTQFVGQYVYTSGRLEKMLDTSYTLAQRTSGRSNLATAGWEIFLEHPLGVGTSGFRYTISSHRLYEGAERPAHSAWIRILAENGVLGIILFTAYVASFAVVGLRKREQGLFFSGLLVTLVLSIGFLSKEFHGKGLWFLVAGSIVLLHPEQLMDYLPSNRWERLRRKYRS
jgi:hypothetical protein